MLYAATLKSPYASAEIVSIDTSKAEALDGVKAVLTYEDIASLTSYAYGNRKVLSEKSCYVGDQIAAVAATSLEIAQKAVELIDVKYNILTPIFDLDEAMEDGAATVHGSIVKDTTIAVGDMEQGFRDADTSVEISCMSNSIHPVPPENHVHIASWDGAGNLTLWSTTQRISDNRYSLATWLKIPVANTRVIAMHVGGGFGNKGDDISGPRFQVLAALLAKKAGMPVKYTADIHEMFTSTHGRFPVKYSKVKLGAKSDGTLVAGDIASTTNLCAYGVTVLTNTNRGNAFSSYFPLPNYKYVFNGTWTNRQVGGYIRGVGSPPAHFAFDLCCDELAEKLDMDPVDFLLKGPAVLAVECPGATLPSSCALTQCINEGAEMIGWKSKWHKPGTKTLANGKKHGIGVAIASHEGGFVRTYNSCRVEFFNDGTVKLYSGVQDSGQHTATILGEICAEALKMSMDKISVFISDTGMCPYGPPSIASQVTVGAGLPVIRACADVKNKLLQFAAPLMKVEVSDLEMEEGVIFQKTQPDNKLTVAAVCGNSSVNVKVVTGDGYSNFTTSKRIGPFLAGFAEVEIDTDTGMVEVTNWLASLDIGTPINKMSVEGQCFGGTQMGMGYALNEGFVFDETTGVLLNPNMVDYKTVTSADMPEVTINIVDSYDPVGPFGAKGCAELMTNPVGPCILNAIYNAIGVRLRKNTLTPADILAALGKI
jgi:xanthine dehydrogenase molybdenum-binding subunit